MTIAVLVPSACFDFEEPILIEAAGGGSNTGQGGSTSDGVSAASGGGASGASGGGVGGSGVGGSGVGGSGVGGGGVDGSGVDGSGVGGGVAGEGGGDPGEASANSASGGSTAGTGGNSEDIPTDDLVLWFRSDAGVIYDDDYQVERWENQAVAGFDATQTLEAARPLLVTPTDSPLPMLEFDGDFKRLALPPGFEDFSGGLSVFAIASVLSEQSCVAVVYLGDAPWVNDVVFGQDHGYGGSYYRVGDWTELMPDDGFWSGGGTVLASVVHSSQAINLYVNGQLSTTSQGALPPVMLRYNNFIGYTLETEFDGCDRFLHGHIGEILLYSRAVSGQERSRIEAYLQDKWRF